MNMFTAYRTNARPTEEPFNPEDMNMFNGRKGQVLRCLSGALLVPWATLVLLLFSPAACLVGAGSVASTRPALVTFVTGPALFALGLLGFAFAAHTFHTIYLALRDEATTERLTRYRRHVCLHHAAVWLWGLAWLLTDHHQAPGMCVGVLAAIGLGLGEMFTSAWQGAAAWREEVEAG
jgi:hypothetical protein